MVDQFLTVSSAQQVLGPVLGFATLLVADSRLRSNTGVGLLAVGYMTLILTLLVSGKSSVPEMAAHAPQIALAGTAVILLTLGIGNRMGAIFMAGAATLFFAYLHHAGALPPASKGIVLAIGIAYGVILARVLVIDLPRNRERVLVSSGPAGGTKAPAQDQSSFAPQRPRYTFADVVGMDDTKARLLEAAGGIVTTVTTGKRRKKRAAVKSGAESRNGILLFGDPGNGKTLFAEALAGELGLGFIKLTFSDVASRWVNQSTEGVREAFDAAMRHAPCLLFVDEIDSFLIDRATVLNGDSESARTTNTLLTLINDLRRYPVILVAATNHLDRLDSAGAREGRFDFKVEVPMPDLPARRAIIEASVRKSGLPCDEAGLNRAVRRWEGFAASRIAAIGKEAASQAIKSGAQLIGFDDLQAALRTIQGSQGDRISEDTPGLEGVFLPDESRQRLAGIARRMKRIDEIEEKGGTLPTGILFYGPPGTGKTLAARALAKETGWALIVTSGHELLSDEKVIDKIIKRANDIRPVIVFIDEGDDVLADRSNSPWSKSVTNRLLTAMDGAKGRVADVVWVSATNHPDALDAAVVRGGRIQEKIRFDLPDADVLAGWAGNWIASNKATFADGLTADVIARELAPMAIADAKAVLQGAVNHMLSGEDNEVTVVTLEHLRMAKADVLMG